MYMVENGLTTDKDDYRNSLIWKRMEMKDGNDENDSSSSKFETA
jgi:hypothetical protein